VFPYLVLVPHVLYPLLNKLEIYNNPAYIDVQAFYGQNDVNFKTKMTAVVIEMDDCSWSKHIEKRPNLLLIIIINP